MTMGDRICIMNKGEVVQIGRPLEVYRAPADVFVARFLGNPPMNLMKGTIEVGGEQAVLRLAGVPIALDDWPAATLRRHAGREVTMGIRPEDIYAKTGPGPEDRGARLAAEIVAVEPLGAETLLVLSVAPSGAEIIARTGRDTSLRSGEPVGVTLDASALHLFDSTSGKAIPRAE